MTEKGTGPSAGAGDSKPRMWMCGFCGEPMEPTAEGQHFNSHHPETSIDARREFGFREAPQ